MVAPHVALDSEVCAAELTLDLRDGFVERSPVLLREVRCPILVGRDQELGALLDAVDRATTGVGSVVFVVGEAGVGKSRVAAAAADVARSRGMAVIRGRAAPSPVPAPFRAITEALLSGLRGSRHTVSDELAPYRAALGVLVPGSGAPGDPGLTEPSLVLLGEALLALLQHLRGDGGLFVLLEDLQWADPETVSLLEYVVDKLDDDSTIVVATLRTGEATDAERQAVELASRGQAGLIELRRLTPESVDRMLVAALGTDTPPDQLPPVIEAASEGVPLLVEELLASLVDAGSLVRDPSGWHVVGDLEPAVPSSFAASVEARFTRMAPSERHVVEAAAVLGERFDWRLLGPTTGASEAEVVGALHAAAGAQLVEEDRRGGGFRFRHALTRSAVLGALFEPERLALADRALEAVTSEAGAAVGDRLELAADLALMAGENQRAAQLLVDAAAEAMSRGALASARRAAERVADMADDVDVVVQALELLLDAGVLAGELAAVAGIGERLLRRLEGAEAPEDRRASAHLRLARAAVVATDWERARAHLDAASQLAPVPSGSLWATWQLLAAHVALGEHRVDDAARHAEAARAAAGGGLDEVRCESLELLGRALRVRDIDAAERMFGEAYATAEQAGLRLWQARALHELGTIDMLLVRSPERLHEASAVATEVGAPGLAAVADFHSAALHFQRHELDVADQFAERAASAASRHHLGQLVPVVWMTVGAIAAVRGDRDRADAVFHEYAVLADAEVTAIGHGMVLALAALAVEDRAAAVMELVRAEQIAPPESAAARAPHRGLWALLVALDPDLDQCDVERLLREEPGLRGPALAAIDVAHAVTVGCQGRADAASAAFARGDRALASTPWFRHIARRLAAEAAIRDGWGDPTVWLRESLAFFEQAGLDEPARACRSLLRKAGAVVPRRSGGAGALADSGALGITTREADVLALVADGLPSKEIAERLYVSPRTVEKHIERLLMKTGTSNRVQLVALAARISAV